MAAKRRARKTDDTLPLPPILGADLIPLTDLASLAAAGVAHPRTVNGLRWIFRNRHANGHAKSFRREGSRILVSVPDFLAAQRQKVAA